MKKNLMLKNFYIFLIIIFSINVIGINCYSVEPDEILKNSQKELIARNISKNIRCMVCQNQSIDDSLSPFAKDLRIIIRKKITEGYNEKEVYEFLTERYGDFILLKPAFKINTFLLWTMPFILFFVGLFIIYWHNKKSKQ